MRHLTLCLPILLVAGCSAAMPANNASVDINAAAMQAQDTVDAYGANTGTGHEASAIAETDSVNAATDAGDPEGNALAPLNPPAPGTPGGLPDNRTPVAEGPFTPDSAQGAANVVQTYYAQIGEGRYAQAFALRDGAPGPKTAQDFAASFARYSEYHANVGAPGPIDAGAGQRYVTVPVQIYARLKDGARPVYEIGSVTLHRTGDIDGATAAQRSWRIRAIDLKAAPTR